MPVDVTGANPDQNGSGVQNDGTNQNTQTSGNPADTNGGVNGTGNGNQPQTRQFTYAEDRTDWVPRHRLNQESGRYQTEKQQRESLQAQYEDAQRKIRVLSGAESVPPEQQEEQAIRSAILKMFPGLEMFGPAEAAAKLDEIMNGTSQAQAAAAHHWEQHSETMFTNLESEAADIAGVDKLTDRQRGQLRRAYRDEANDHLRAVESASQRGDQPPAESLAFLDRHTRGDRTLVSEFAKSFMDEWFTPARRAVTSEAVGRNRPVPRGDRSRPMAQQPKKYDFSKPGAFEEAFAEAHAHESNQR